MASWLMLAAPTVDKYLWYLEKTFIISPVTPYFKNPRAEIKKTHTYYFNDLGLRNYVLGELAKLDGGLGELSEPGFLFQQLVFLTLKNLFGEFEPASIHFWRTKAKAEVDLSLIHI